MAHIEIAGSGEGEQKIDGQLCVGNDLCQLGPRVDALTVMDVDLAHRTGDGGSGMQGLLCLLIGQLGLLHRDLGPVHGVLGIAAVHGVQQGILRHQVALLKGGADDVAGQQRGDVVGVRRLQCGGAGDADRQILPGSSGHQITAAELVIDVFRHIRHAAHHDGRHDHQDDEDLQPAFLFLSAKAFQRELLFLLLFRRRCALWLRRGLIHPFSFHGM